MLTKQQLEPSPVKRAEAISVGLAAYKKYALQVKNHDYVVIINMREPSYRKRFYIINSKNEIIRNHHTTHGINSSDTKDRAYAISFGNVVGSSKSSLGAMITGDTYVGKHGRSLRLHGLEKGINDNVLKRYIVIHSADYVKDAYIRQMGRAGQSNGCPALDPAVCQKVIDLIKGGCFVYIYY